MLTLKPANSGGYRAYRGNFYVGEIDQGKSPEFGWLPAFDGHWSADALRDIADAIDHVNERHCRALCGPSSESVGRNYIPSPSKEPPFGD